MSSLSRNTKKPTGSIRREPPQNQAPIPLHIELHIERPRPNPNPSEPTPSRVIVIDLVGD